MARTTARVVCIAAFSLEIADFLDKHDLQHLRRSSRLLWTAFELRACRQDSCNRAQGVLSLIQNQAIFARELRVVLQNARGSASAAAKNKTKRSKRGSIRLRDDQILPLMRDLGLVGLGVRASCLVDTCQLDHKLVCAMTAAFSKHEQWLRHGLHHLSAILMAGNVFFVHRSAFVRLKCLDLATDLRNVMFINAGRELNAPALFSDTLDDDQEIRRRLVGSVKRLMDTVVDYSLSRELYRPPIQLHTNGVCATAMAGVILCYPAIYHIGAVSSMGDCDSFWTTGENCLGMCPLLLFQALLSPANAIGEGLGVRTALQEFSIPQQLTPNGEPYAAKAFSPQRIIAQCKSALERAVGGTELFSVDVEVTERTLPQVAL